jgi:hypothetical protein
MKYYETTFEEYLGAIQKINYHPELVSVMSNLPAKNDIIFYGPSGVGKYSQILEFLRTKSPSQLSYFKKIIVCIDKNKKTPLSLQMSDIHFEIDMSLLGCNAKKVWHEIFVQLVDVVKLREKKHCYFVCKNFHNIHTELLEIFYSFMQHYRPRVTDRGSDVQISYILSTEHLSFLPNSIMQSCALISVKRPEKRALMKGLQLIRPGRVGSGVSGEADEEGGLRTAKQFLRRIHARKNATYDGIEDPVVNHLVSSVDTDQVLNMKEYICFSLLPDLQAPTGSALTEAKWRIGGAGDGGTPGDADKLLGKLSEDIFNKVCDQIVEKIMQIPATNTAEWFAEFRDALYLILICNLDASECVYYVLQHFIASSVTGSGLNVREKLDIISVGKFVKEIYPFLLYYNNNYRPIYHLEKIFLLLVVELQKSGIVVPI